MKLRKLVTSFITIFCMVVLQVMPVYAQNENLQVTTQSDVVTESQVEPNVVVPSVSNQSTGQVIDQSVQTASNVSEESVYQDDTYGANSMGDYKVKQGASKEGTMKKVLSGILLFAASFVMIASAIACRASAASFWAFYAASVAYIMSEMQGQKKQKTDHDQTLRELAGTDDPHIQAEALIKASELKSDEAKRAQQKADIQFAAAAGYGAAAALAMMEAGAVKKAHAQCTSAIQSASTQSASEGASLSANPATATIGAGSTANSSAISSTLAGENAAATASDQMGASQICEALQAQEASVSAQQQSTNSIQPKGPIASSSTSQAIMSCEDSKLQRKMQRICCAKVIAKDYDFHSIEKSELNYFQKLAYNDLVFKSFINNQILEARDPAVMAILFDEYKMVKNGEVISSSLNEFYSLQENIRFWGVEDSLITFKEFLITNLEKGIDFVFPKAHAMDDQQLKMVGIGSGLLLGLFASASASMKAKVKAMLGSPKTRTTLFAVFAGLAGGVAFMSNDQAKKLRKEAKELLEKGMDLRAKALLASISTKSANEINPNNNFQGSPGLSSDVNLNITGTEGGAGSYSQLEQNILPSVIDDNELCFGAATENNPSGVNPNCGCQIKDQCLKIDNIDTVSQSVSDFGGKHTGEVLAIASQVISSANSLAKGSTRKGIQAASNLKGKVAKLNQINGELKNKFNLLEKKLGENVTDFKKSEGQLEASIKKATLDQAGSEFSSKRYAASTNLGVSDKEQKGKYGRTSLVPNNSKGYYRYKGKKYNSKSLKNFSFNTGDDATGLNMKGGESLDSLESVLEKEGKDLDIKMDDVAHERGNIWKIISNRYVRSAIPRLSRRVISSEKEK